MSEYVQAPCQYCGQVLNQIHPAAKPHLQWTHTNREDARDCPHPEGGWPIPSLRDQFAVDAATVEAQSQAFKDKAEEMFPGLWASMMSTVHDRVSTESPHS